MEIYTQFSSRICGFKPTITDDSSSSDNRVVGMPDNEKQCEQLVGQLNNIIKEIDITMASQPNVTNKVSFCLFSSSLHPLFQAYQAVGVIRDLLSHLAMNPKDPASVINCVTKSVEHLLHAFHVDPNTKSIIFHPFPSFSLRFRSIGHRMATQTS